MKPGQKCPASISPTSTKACWKFFKQPKKAEHARHIVEQAHELGLTDTQLLDYNALQQLEPHTKINGIGAILFNCDAHLYPNKLMQGLIALLQKNGVQLLAGEEVVRFEKQGNAIKKVITAKNAWDADMVVMATGSWSREIAALMDLKLPLMPGRGYSVTLENSPYRVNYPAILVEGRAAITPMDGNKIRFGGTMEITSTKTPPRMSRVQGILNAVKRFYPEFEVPLPAAE